MNRHDLLILKLHGKLKNENKLKVNSSRMREHNNVDQEIIAKGNESNRERERQR